MRNHTTKAGPENEPQRQPDTRSYSPTHTYIRTQTHERPYGKIKALAKELLSRGRGWGARRKWNCRSYCQKKSNNLNYVLQFVHPFLPTHTHTRSLLPCLFLFIREIIVCFVGCFYYAIYASRTHFYNISLRLLLHFVSKRAKWSHGQV